MQSSKFNLLFHFCYWLLWTSIGKLGEIKLAGLSVNAQKEMGSKSSTKCYGIPEGKGPYSVGCTDLMTDYTIQGSFFRLYYPSQNGTSSEETKWIPRKEYYRGLSDFLNIYRMLGETLFQHYVGSVTCPAKWNAAFKPGEKYPLIIFSHGLGAFRTIYSAICIEMASQGFIVAAVEHRDKSSSATYYHKENPVCEAQEEATENPNEEWIYYRKLKRGEQEFPLRHQQLQQRTEECIKALDLILGINNGNHVANVLSLNFDWTLLKESIDTDRIAVMGHSFGAATAIKTLSKDARFKGSVHQSFPDFTFLSGNFVGKIFKLKGDIDPNIAIDISNKASLAFLQKHLGLKKDFDQWDALVDGEGHNVIPGTNIDLPSTQPESLE
ncbi:platelet-activating factor acetylhydrolase isoform X4 [Mauremys reevesii]|uniref:platelet-activating factor acetylhydrolase isoform X4 n=1 Tax=Mauremys reevesii TaxID=260615 RepID=UPI00193F9E5B|nr:platelet-activating factor acetylhydrolase isoform X4 [Mauremys reevesii]